MSDFEQYRKDANRTRAPQECTANGVFNAALGLAGEVGEALELIKKNYFHGKDYDRERLRSELGDVLFYLDWLAALNGMTLGEVADANIAKLKARYPDGWVSGGGIR